MTLSDERLRAIWERDVRPYVFRGAEPSSQPTTVLLGGQPGAGKSAAGELAADQVPGLVPIVGDDFRQFHPDYEQVMREDPLRMPDVTAQAAGRWIQMSVDHANEHGYSALIEGTWRNATVPLQAARDAKKNDREVMAVVVATQPELSRLGTMERYYRDADADRDARWTPPDAHDNTVASLPASVEAVAMSGDVDSLRVTNRAGDSLFHDEGPPSPERADGAVRALHEGMAKPLSPSECRRYESSVKAMSAAHERHTSHDSLARGAWTQIMTHDLPVTRSRTARSLAKPAANRRPGSEAGKRPRLTGERSYRSRGGPAQGPRDRGPGKGD